jgi:hypothetical protein
MATFRKAARAAANREQPTPRKRRKKGRSDGDRFTSRKLATDYVNLCQHPIGDLRRWLAEDKKRAGGQGRQIEATTTKGGTTRDWAYNATKNAPLAYADGLCRHSLQLLRGGLDAHRQGRGQADNLFARSRAGSGRYDTLRPVRTEADAATLAPRDGGRSAPDLSFGAERDAIHALYGAKIEATRRSLPRGQVADAIRAIIDEQRAALRAVTLRRILAKTARRERRATGRHAAFLAQQNARAPPESRL